MGSGFVIVLLPEQRNGPTLFFDGVASMVEGWPRAHIYVDRDEALRKARECGMPVDVIEYRAMLGNHIKRFFPQCRGDHAAQTI